MIIDHHASNDAAGEADWIDPHAAATCEMVALLAARLGVDPAVGDGALATNLMAGIVMDTATFAHPERHAADARSSSAWLVEAGAPLSDISRRLYRSKPDAQLRLFGRILDRLESADDGRIVWSSVTDADYAETGAERAHSEGLIDLLSQAEAAEVAILFKEAGPKETRISVRTRPGGVDATVLTGRFGGGGHARAAGATIQAPLAEARPPVLAEATRLAAAVRPLTMARASLGPGLDGILVVAKPAGPTSHDVVGAGSPAGRHEARRAWRHARPVRIGRAAGLPRPCHAGRRIPPRRPQGLPGDGLFRRLVDDRRSGGRARRRPTGPAPDAGGRRGRAWPGSSARSRSGRRPTARSRSAVAGRTPWRVPARPWSWRRATSRSTRSTLDPGTTRDPIGPSPSSTCAVRPGPTSGRWRAISARRSAARPTSAP